MSTSPARAAAFDVLFRVERNDSYASELLHSTQLSKLSSADHALTTEMVMGVLLCLDRIPGRAAVHESVELVKRARKGSAAPFANAVLRKLASASTNKALHQ